MSLEYRLFILAFPLMLQKSSFGNTKLVIKGLLYSAVKQFKLIFCLESYYSNNKKKR